MVRRARENRHHYQAQKSSLQSEIVQGGCHKRRQSPLQGIDWIITNDLDETVTTQVVRFSGDLRWQVEEFHRGLKQLTGSEKCQCRKARSQRNHLACGDHAWLSLKVQAKALDKTI